MWPIVVQLLITIIYAYMYLDILHTLPILYTYSSDTHSDHVQISNTVCVILYCIIKRPSLWYCIQHQTKDICGFNDHTSSASNKLS